MAEDKPLISIVMAVYHPRMDWLAEQLDSLNAQTYPNLELIVCDDGPDAPVEERVFAEHITAFPWELVRNEENLGSNKTFERLTQMARGEYIAYCDQDDIWLPQKLAVLQETIEKEKALLACSDMFIINGEGRQTADSITKVRRHHVFHSGTNLAEGLLTHNFVTGCTMLVMAKDAKDALPYCPYMVHDHYIALWCAERGRIVSLPQPLIRYRIHGGNQTGIMSGVADKESYGRVRIELPLQKMQWLSEHFPCGAALKERICECTLWLQARKSNWAGQGGGATVWKYRRFSPLPSVAELLAGRLPDRWFQLAVAQVRKNRI